MSNSKTLKSGLWYTAANFLQKGIGFLTTPIFTRMLTKEEFGEFSNFTSWLGILMIICTLNLASTLISAKFDYENEFDSYIMSILTLGGISTLAWALLFNVFGGLSTSLFNMSRTYMNCMMVYMLFSIAVDIYQVKSRYCYEYKSSVLISLLLSIGASLLSVVLVVLLPNKLLGRTLGYVIPMVLIGLVLYIYFAVKRKKILFSAWKYAIKICLPYIPHLLSLVLLNSMDKIMITDMIGEEANAMYSLAYTCGALITILVNSMNGAFSPWLGDKLHNKEYSTIRKISAKYVAVFVYFAFAVMLIAPEILMILGGEQYYEAIYAIPPVTMGCICQFVYTLYVNVEQYEKKTVGMAIGSVTAALLNWGLNLWLIPKFGYVAAAYTTLISFLYLFAVHLFLVYRVKLHIVYPNKLFIFGLLALCGATVGISFLYSFPVVRYIVCALYLAVSVVAVIKYRKQLAGLLKSLIRKS